MKEIKSARKKTKELVYRRRRHAAASLSVKLCQQVRGRFSLSLEVSRWEAAQADERQGNCFHPENQPCLSFDGYDGVRFQEGSCLELSNYL